MYTYSKFEKPYMIIFSSADTVKVNLNQIKEGYNNLGDIFKGDYLIESYFYLGSCNIADFVLRKGHATFFISFVPANKLLEDYSNNTILLAGVRYSVVGSKSFPIDLPNWSVKGVYKDFKWCQNYFHDSRELQLDGSMLQVSISFTTYVILPIDHIEALVSIFRNALPGATQYNLRNLDDQSLVCKEEYMIQVVNGVTFLIIYNLVGLECLYLIRHILAELPLFMRSVLKYQITRPKS